MKVPQSYIVIGSGFFAEFAAENWAISKGLKFHKTKVGSPLVGEQFNDCVIYVETNSPIRIVNQYIKEEIITRVYPYNMVEVFRFERLFKLTN